MTEQQKQIYMNWFSDGFDVYAADGRPPVKSPIEGDDLLGQYVRNVIDRNPNLGGSDPNYRESFKENLQQFMGDMLDEFGKIDRACEPEKLMQQYFQKGSANERRRMWQQVKDFANENYSPEELNADGYDAQLNGNNEQQIFDMFAEDWLLASQGRVRQIKRQHLASAAANWEKSCSRYCKSDYKMRLKIKKSLRHYPLMEEIAKIIGRQQNVATAEKSRAANRYRPSSISANPSFEEIDRITTGNNIERVIPSEFLYLADPETEMIFMARYARRQLQQFAAPGMDIAIKNPESRPQPRPALGPIIVSVDTSGSMRGRPMEIAFAMLHQLIDTARRTRRNCFLITFSVQSQSIDLCEPGRWRNVDQFLSTSYSGGTNGERMLHDALMKLGSDNYSMADVLIISDFAFAMPRPDTLAAIRREQAADTRFYGLQIGRINTPYSKILNRIWATDCYEH